MLEFEVGLDLGHNEKKLKKLDGHYPKENNAGFPPVFFHPVTLSRLLIPIVLIIELKIGEINLNLSKVKS